MKQEEVLVPEHIISHHERKVKGRVARRYRVKFKNYSVFYAQRMEEEELANSPQVLQLYLEAFNLQPTTQASSGSSITLSSDSFHKFSLEIGIDPG